MALTYKDAGVNVEAGYEAVTLMKQHVSRTITPQVLSGLGSFGGCYALEGQTGQSVLVAGTDGVGTKLKVAYAMDKHDTVGIDCVAMSVNDVICQGARPLFFLDYIATDQIKPEKIADIVKGVAEGCVQAGCALIGGETAEMPGIYAENEYDLAGFAVGIVERDKVITGDTIRPGDVLVGLASAGVHSNGFSLVRKLITEDMWHTYSDALGGTWGEVLLTPTRIYVKAIMPLLAENKIKGIAHITGGGFIENIPRMLPQGCAAEIKKGSWPIHPVFQKLQQRAGCDDNAMYNTFNMGIGMVVAIACEDADAVIAALQSRDYPAYVIGSVVQTDDAPCVIL